MTIKGKPGDTVWVRATLKKIVITEAGVEYIVNPKETNERLSYKTDDVMFDEKKTAEELMHEADQALAESPLC